MVFETNRELFFLSKKDLVAILSLALLIKAVKYLKAMIRKGFASGLSTVLMKKLSQELMDLQH
ncbi:hypothetical protein NST74_07165 [Paenibacillus sp. FSL F4-0125]|uniref:hypothetical protein n=1 Tax=Paenibacillus sp. FSL F4-0125 TaxID=2954730 RepID=UPI0030F59847